MRELVRTSSRMVLVPQVRALALVLSIYDGLLPSLHRLELCSGLIDGRVALQRLSEVPRELHLARVEDGEVPHPGLAERLYLSLRAAATAGVDVRDALY